MSYLLPGAVYCRLSLRMVSAIVLICSCSNRMLSQSNLYFWQSIP